LVDKEVNVLQVKWRQEEVTRRATKKVLGLNEERRDPTPAEIEEELERVPDYTEQTVSYLKFRSSCKKVTKADHVLFQFEKSMSLSSGDVQLLTHVRTLVSPSSLPISLFLSVSFVDIYMCF
jgi:hypothetical protein